MRSISVVEPQAPNAESGDRQGVRLNTIPLRELLRKEIPPKEPLLSPWFGEGESALVYAPTGAGKSLFVMTVALAVAGGGRFLGWEAPRAARVLLVDGEMPLDVIQNRFMSCGQAVAGSDLKATGLNLTVLPWCLHDGDLDEFPDLSTSKGQEAILTAATKGINGSEPFDAVILDNLSTLFHGIENENGASDFTPVVKFLLKLKKAGIAVILIHHANKANKGYRGSSKLGTTFETILHLNPVKATAPNVGVSFKLEWEKFRASRIGMNLLDGQVSLIQTEDDGWQWWAGNDSSEVKVDRVERVVELLRSRRFTSQKAIASEMNTSQGTVSKWITEAKERGIITADEVEDCLSKTLRSSSPVLMMVDGGSDTGDF